jgi:AmmeMemoRadiSam system protein A
MPLLTPEEGGELLKIAANAVRAKVLCDHTLAVTPSCPALLKPGAAFVTLKNRGVLRGCIGRLLPLDPLYATVVECAISAATRDPRFDAVTPGELPELGVDISVLGPLEVLDDWSEIEIGTHGVYVEKGGFRGVLLPQVAVEMKLNREQFLEMTCKKAGLHPEAWKQGAVIKVFTAQILHSELSDV